MDNLQEGNMMLADAPKKILPPSPSHSSRETNKKYVEALTKIKHTVNPPMYITSKGYVPAEQNTTELPEYEYHLLKSAKYIVEYVKKGTQHLTIVLQKDDTQSTTA